jgi:hypothetical protein
MPKRKITSIKQLGRTKQGCFFRNLGWVKSSTGNYTQRKFYLGYDEDPAKLASARLEALWKCVEQLHAMNLGKSQSCVVFDDQPPRLNLEISVALGNDGSPSFISKPGKPIWNEISLVIAECIRNGDPVAHLPLKLVCQELNVKHEKWLTATLVSRWLNTVRSNYPCIHIDVTDRQLSEQIYEQLHEEGAKLVESGKALMREPLSNQKLHHAIEAYKSSTMRGMVDRDGESSEWAKAKCRQIEFVKKHSTDLDLSQLGGPSITTVLEVLRLRPVTVQGKPCSVRHSQNCIKEFRKMLEWLDDCDAYDWSWPTNFKFKSPKVSRTAVPNEKVPNVARQRQNRYFNETELKTVYVYATPIQRLYFLLGINCGFGNAEMTTLLLDDIFLHQQHPDENLFHFNSKSTDSWIVRERTKTHVIGTWKLWRETVLGIQWWLEERNRIKVEYSKSRKKHDPEFEVAVGGRFLVTQNGRSIADKNRRTGRIPNSWNSLIRRIQGDHSDFKKRSLGKLRKTGATLVRQISNGELASIYLAHGKPYGDDKDLECYADCPYGQLFELPKSCMIACSRCGSR